jgi:hypothetical protein
MPGLFFGIICEEHRSKAISYLLRQSKRVICTDFCMLQTLLGKKKYREKNKTTLHHRMIRLERMWKEAVVA